MDLYCSRCGEPYEVDYVMHDMKILERVDFNTGKGCPSCKERKICDRKNKCSDCEQNGSDGCHSKMFKRPFRAEAAAMLHDLLGDDVDGIAAEMEDAEAMFGGEFDG